MVLLLLIHWYAKSQVLCRPFNCAQVDYVFEIISAPSADEHKMKTESNLGNTKHGNVGRRMSQALRRMSEAVSATAASATERVVKRKTTSFILEETTRVVPDSVIHSHALAQSALGQSLIEALAKRQTFVSCDLGANLRASGGEWTSDVESGSPRTSRYLRRIHSIVSAALPSSDSIRSTSILPISPVETSETAWDDQNILAQLSHDIQSEYDLLPISEQADFAEAWSWDPERKSFISRDISLCDVMCGRKCNITEQAVSEELRAIQTEFETRMGNLETATDVHVGKLSMAVAYSVTDDRIFSRSRNYAPLYVRFTGVGQSGPENIRDQNSGGIQREYCSDSHSQKACMDSHYSDEPLFRVFFHITRNDKRICLAERLCDSLCYSSRCRGVTIRIIRGTLGSLRDSSVGQQ